VLQGLATARSFEKARDFAETSLLSDPNNNNLRYVLGFSCYELARSKTQLFPSEDPTPLFKRASTLLEDVVRKDPGHQSELGGVLNEFGSFLMRRGRFEEAGIVFKQAVEHQRVVLGK